MPRKGKQSTSRKLVWVEGQTFAGWGCDECAWLFNFSGPLSAKSLDEMKRTFQAQLSEEFMVHVCAEHPRDKGRLALSA
jgi:hypothetical protein